jgi:hypothetical protein
MARYIRVLKNDIVRKEMPNPTPEEMASPQFEAIWNIIKTWDINVPEYYSGYSGGNGSHVKLILDELKVVMRDHNLGKILE